MQPHYPRRQPYASQGSRAGERRDGMKIALAIEGGGMRGCVAAGMAAAVSELGLIESFDAVYGSSAGSLIGAYMLSGQDYRFGCSGGRDPMNHDALLTLTLTLSLSLCPWLNQTLTLILTLTLTPTQTPTLTRILTSLLRRP